MIVVAILGIVGGFIGVVVIVRRATVVILEVGGVVVNVAIGEDGFGKC